MTGGEKVQLALGDSFTGRMGALKQAAEHMNFILQRDAATWEPHDWAEWD